MANIKTPRKLTVEELKKRRDELFVKARELVLEVEKAHKDSAGSTLRFGKGEVL